MIGSPRVKYIKRLVWLGALTAILGVFLAPAFAQAELQLQLGAREIEAGESVNVELTAMGSSEDAPSAPQLAVPAGVEVRGPSVGTRQQVSMSNFRIERRVGLTATWTVTANKPGLYSLGPASVQVGKSRQQSVAVQLKVVPKGQLSPQTQRRRRRRRDLLAPFSRSNPFDDLFDSMRERGGFDRRLPQAPNHLILSEVPDKTAFVHSVVSKDRVVVGEQVTLSVYAYGARGIFQEAAGSREPSYSDFLAQRLVEDPSEQPVYQFEARGQDWIVVKIREVALFPLRSGKLSIGPTQFGFLGSRYSGRSSRGLVRESGSHEIVVEQPPMEGRPPGFAGDVGQYRLEASVQPRQVTAGDSVAVKIRVQGRGRFPARVKLPEQNGVHWDEPTISDSPQLEGTKVGGARQLQYIVQLAEAGDIDLGVVRLPYFDPQTQQYAVASISLGRVLVAQSSQPLEPSSAQEVTERLGRPALWRPLTLPEPVAHRAAPLLLPDRAWFWWIVGGAPLGSLALFAVHWLVRLLGRRRAEEGESLPAQSRLAAAQARQALTCQDLNTALQRMERAVYLAAEARTGVRGRGVLRSNLNAALVEAGLEGKVAREVVRVLDSFESVRFSGEATQGEVLMQQVSELLEQLLRARRTAGPGGTALLVLMVSVPYLLGSSFAHAQPAAASQEPSSAGLSVGDSFRRGSYSATIDQLELWSDQGRKSRDLSFNRGLAYLGRAESSAAEPADLGQAAAGFTEAYLLDSDDEQARALAEAVRTKLAEERSKLVGNRVEARPRLLRALVELLGDQWWAAIALFGSFTLTVGLWMHRLGRPRVSPAVTVLAAALGGALMLGAGSMVLAGVHFRKNFVPAVVIVPEAQLLGATGLPVRRETGPSASGGAGDRVGMGALVHVAEAAGALCRVQWGEQEGYLHCTALRRLTH